MIKLFLKSRKRRLRIKKIKRCGIDVAALKKANRKMQLASVQWQQKLDVCLNRREPVQYIDVDTLERLDFYIP